MSTAGRSRTELSHLPRSIRSMMRHTTFRFALDPTPAQRQVLSRHAGASRFAYNQCLRLVADARFEHQHDPSVDVPWTIRVHDDTRRLRRMLRPLRHRDVTTGKELTAPRARIVSATVVRHADRWYVSLTLHAPDLHPQRRHPAQGTGRQPGFVGVDRGLSQFVVAATADGSEISRWPAPRSLAGRLQRLRCRSRAVSRKRRGSANRARSVRQLSREYARIKTLRRSFLHEVSGQLAKTHSRLVIEDLQVANLMANRRPARAIVDAGWTEFARQLTYKAQWSAPNW
jgi:putative transposase